MRLINADKLTLVTEFIDGVPHSYYEQFDIDEAPTVEAIPIEYIQHWIDKKNYGRRDGKMMLAKDLNELIAEWRKEHEID